jgi:hypothetical protein
MDAAFRSLSYGLTHRRIRNQQSQAVRQVCRVTAAGNWILDGPRPPDSPQRRC